MKPFLIHIFLCMQMMLCIVRTTLPTMYTTGKVDYIVQKYLLTIHHLSVMSLLKTLYPSRITVIITGMHFRCNFLVVFKFTFNLGFQFRFSDGWPLKGLDIIYSRLLKNNITCKIKFYDQISNWPPGRNEGYLTSTLNKLKN